MTHTELIARLRKLHEAATPGDLSTADITEDGDFICPHCDGIGEVAGEQYINYDGVAANVLFTGIGHEFGANRNWYIAICRDWPEISDALTASQERIMVLEGALRDLADASTLEWDSDYPKGKDPLSRARAALEAGQLRNSTVEIPDDDVTIRCNKCWWHGSEDDLVATIDAIDKEPSRACPTCKTDNYLMDISIDAGLIGTISTPRHSAVRYQIGNEAGDVFGRDSGYDGPTLTVEIADMNDGLAMLRALAKGGGDG